MQRETQRERCNRDNRAHQGVQVFCQSHTQRYKRGSEIHSFFSVLIITLSLLVSPQLVFHPLCRFSSFSAFICSFLPPLLNLLSTPSSSLIYSPTCTCSVSFLSSTCVSCLLNYRHAFVFIWEKHSSSSPSLFLSNHSPHRLSESPILPLLLRLLLPSGYPSQLPFCITPRNEIRMKFLPGAVFSFLSWLPSLLSLPDSSSRFSLM